MDKINYTDKPISQFDENNTIYMTKKSNGFSIYFILKFKSFDKGMVTGEILDIQPNNQIGVWIGKNYHKIGSELSGRISSCYTFGNKKGCNWFKKIGKNWTSK